ncbi:MAG: nucleotidyltransferase family protein [Clostridia bacterium]|nr:nucleotidyltransferase family protein [Clostridia bacterium]
MLTAGIIAEYNPFHNGHALLIEKARAAGATHVVAVMSGNFVQRGEPALFHHIERTRAALAGGADLVVQLPVPYAVSGAQSFARAGVEILNSLGCVDWLVFGSECGNADKIIETAKAVYGDKIKDLLADELKKGISFASARENALREINPVYADIIKTPNNILGVEYAAAINRINSRMKPVTFAREGAEHDSADSNGRIASASLIREKIRNGGEWSRFVPDGALYSECEISDINKIERAILYKMRTAEGSEIAGAPDVSEGIENRILSAAQDAKSLEELYTLAKTKRYSHARIRRIVLNSFLGITADDLATPVPYIRVTGFNARGAELIRKAYDTAALPVITKAADISCLGEEAQRLFGAECRAGDIYSLCFDEVRECGEEKKLRPVIL